MIIEVLSPTVMVDEQGNILPPDDFNAGDVDEEDICQAAAQHEQETRQTFCGIRTAAVAAARQGNFAPRNSALREAVRAAGKSNRDFGAALLQAYGRGGDIPGAESAEWRRWRRQEAAEQLVGLACRVCPLAALCEPGTDQRVLKAMSEMGSGGRNTRIRLRRRLNSDNDHFCSTNIKPARLRKEVA